MSDFLVWIGVTLLIFLIGREIVCWYFKINRALDVLEDIRDELKKANITQNNV